MAAKIKKTTKSNAPKAKKKVAKTNPAKKQSTKTKPARSKRTHIDAEEPMLELPVFRYYRDPFGTGAFDPCDDPCDCCGRATGFSYHGFLYAEEEVETICPWCVADGSAARKFDGTFVDDHGLSGCRPKAIAELTERTPEFRSFQEAQWLVHCGEPAVYLTDAGYDELQQYGGETLQSVMDNLGDGMSDGKKQGFLRSLRKDGSCVAHVFECLHCQKVIAYGECD